MRIYIYRVPWYNCRKTAEEAIYLSKQNIDEYDIFISYRHKTGFYMAQILYSELIGNGYTVFMDKNMDSGKYEDKIHSAISNCRNFLVVLFPDDVAELNDPSSWLNIEGAWALENENINIVPIMCDGFEWPKTDAELTETMRVIKRNNGLVVHKDTSLDKDLDSLCENFLKNVNSAKPRITALEFFRQNLESRVGFTVTGVDMAFHAGSPWLVAGEKNQLLIKSLKKNIPWRILINTVDAAESIGQYMRDEDALYHSFEQVHAWWKKLADKYEGVLEVRECDIPLIHIYRSVSFINDSTQKPCGEQHIKYYAYNNTVLDNAFEHRIGSYSKLYSVYSNEFEFLWERSKKL